MALIVLSATFMASLCDPTIDLCTAEVCDPATHGVVGTQCVRLKRPGDRCFSLHRDLCLPDAAGEPHACRGSDAGLTCLPAHSLSEVCFASALRGMQPQHHRGLLGTARSGLPVRDAWRRLLSSAALAVACGGQVGEGASAGSAGGTGGSPPAHWRRSCAALAPGADRACGPEGDLDCCEVLPVPDQRFQLRNDTIRTHVSPFRMDRLEVTLGRFRQFLAARPSWVPPPGSGAPAKHPETGWRREWDVHLAVDRADFEAQTAATSFSEDCNPGGDPRLPVNCVNWYEATAFCIWDGGRLQLLIEHDVVYVGGDEQRPYPWGDGPCDLDHGACCDPAAPTLVAGAARLGLGRWGHLDVHGSRKEFSIDSIDRELTSPDCDDCLFGFMTLDGTFIGICGQSAWKVECATGGVNHCVPSPAPDRNRAGIRCIYEGPDPPAE